MESPPTSKMKNDWGLAKVGGTTAEISKKTNATLATTADVRAIKY